MCLRFLTRPNEFRTTVTVNGELRALVHFRKERTHLANLRSATATTSNAVHGLEFR